MINNFGNKESSTSKNTPLAIIMAALIVTQTQANNVIDQKFYKDIASYTEKYNENRIKRVTDNKGLMQQLDLYYNSDNDKDLRTLINYIIQIGAKYDVLKYIENIINTKNHLITSDIRIKLSELASKLRYVDELNEIEGPRDFQIISGNIGSYKFEGNDRFEYLGNNFYAVQVDFEKLKEKRVTSWLKISSKFKKGDLFFIHYDGNNVIKYYSGRSFERKEVIGQTTIDHKSEINIDYKKGKKIIYEKTSEQDIYIRELGMNLTVKFFNK